MQFPKTYLEEFVWGEAVIVALFAGTLYAKLGLDVLKDAAMVSLLHKKPKQDGDLGRESRRTGTDSFRKYGSTEKKRAYSCNRGHHVGCP